MTHKAGQCSPSACGGSCWRVVKTWLLKWVVWVTLGTRFDALGLVFTLCHTTLHTHTRTHSCNDTHVRTRTRTRARAHTQLDGENVLD